MKRITKEKLQKIKLFHKQKLSQRQIAKKIKCSPSTINYWLNKN